MANSDNIMQTTQFELHYDGPVSKGVGHVVLEAATTIAAIQASPTKGNRSTNALSILSPMLPSMLTHCATFLWSLTVPLHYAVLPHSVYSNSIHPSH